MPGLPPGFPGSPLQHPGLPGFPPSSAASLLAGLPPSSSAALMAAHMRMPQPGLAAHQELLRKEEEERERHSTSKPSATPGPMSDERNVSLLSAISLSQ